MGKAYHLRVMVARGFYGLTQWATLGGMTHYGGLAYRHELLEREWPETEAGELAFLEMQGGGWSTGPGEGCPKNPDLFREVIAKGEAFVAGHPRTDFHNRVW